MESFQIWNFQFLDLQKKLAAIEADNRTVRDEFNVQRAKLKELFLQKEGSIQWYLFFSISDTLTISNWQVNAKN